MLISVLIPLFVTILIIKSCFAENITRQVEYAKNRVKYENVEPMFGVLYSQLAYIKWASKEETQLVKVFSRRLELLQTEVEIIQHYLSRQPVKVLSPEPKFSTLYAVKIHKSIHRYSRKLASKIKFKFAQSYNINRLNLNQVVMETQSSVYDPKARNGIRRLAPNRDDLWLTMESYFDVARVYGYQPAQMIYGFNPNHFSLKNGSSLKIRHCMEIGIFALIREQHLNSVEWFEMTTGKNSHFDENTLFLLKNLASHLVRLAIQQHNRLVNSPPMTFTRDIFMNFYTEPIQNNTKARISIRDAVYHETRGYGGSESRSKTEVFAQYWDICSRHNTQPPEIVKKLKCRYERIRHPYLYINPVKVEQLSENPPTYQLYELIGNRRIEQLKRLYSGRVHPLNIPSPGKRKSVPRVRTGGLRLLLPEEVPHLMYKIPEAVTGLRLTADTELFQFAEYTPGRYFDTHPDQLYNQGRESGISHHENLVATLLYYLEVAEVGGSTAMCQGGVHTNPARGSAIVWINMYHNGTVRNDIDHGGCPVLEGQKITMNRWIRYLSNWDTFQCKLDQFL